MNPSWLLAAVLALPAFASRSFDLSATVRSVLNPAQASAFAGDRDTERVVAVLSTDQRESLYARLSAAEISTHNPAELAAIHRGYFLLGRFHDALRVGDNVSRARPSNPDGYVLRGTALSGLGDYEGAVRQAREALARDPRDKSALALLKMNEGRTSSTFPSMRSDTASSPKPSRGRRIQFTAVVSRSAETLLANLPLPPAPERDPGPVSPINAAQGAILAALGASGAFLLFGGVGGRELEKRQPGIKTRMGIAAALGGALATAGYMFIPATPVVAQNAAQTEKLGEELEPYVIRRGEVLNRVWNSDWQTVKNASGKTGASFCRGACLPINSQTAIQQRGLNLPGLINNAREGGLFSATRDISAQARTAIGGIEKEIVIEYEHLHLLEFIEGSHSQLPAGPGK